MQFLLRHALDQMDMDWQCVTAKVDIGSLAKAVTGIAAMKLRGIIFLEPLTTNVLPVDLLDAAADGLAPVTAMRRSEAYWKTHDCQPVAIWESVIAPYLRKRAQVVSDLDASISIGVIGSKAMLQHYAETDSRWATQVDWFADGQHSNLSTDREEESRSQGSSGEKNVPDGNGQDQSPTKSQDTGQLQGIRPPYDVLILLENTLDHLPEIASTGSVYCVTDELLERAVKIGLPSPQRIDENELQLQSCIANLCFIAKIGDPKADGLRLSVLREALDEFQQW